MLRVTPAIQAGVTDHPWKVADIVALVEAEEMKLLPTIARPILEKGRVIGNPITIAGIPLPSDSPLFLAFIEVHVAAGLACVIAGAGAMLSRKQHGRHPQAGTFYYCVACRCGRHDECARDLPMG